MQVTVCRTSATIQWTQCLITEKKAPECTPDVDVMFTYSALIDFLHTLAQNMKGSLGNFTELFFIISPS